jgi:hypothetical protein
MANGHIDYPANFCDLCSIDVDLDKIYEEGGPSQKAVDSEYPVLVFKF